MNVLSKYKHDKTIWMFHTFKIVNNLSTQTEKPYFTFNHKALVPITQLKIRYVNLNNIQIIRSKKYNQVTSNKYTQYN